MLLPAKVELYLILDFPGPLVQLCIHTCPVLWLNYEVALA